MMVLPTGFPESFHTVEEVIKFITMVIFTVTAQHAAVNNGQVSRLDNRHVLFDQAFSLFSQMFKYVKHSADL